MFCINFCILALGSGQRLLYRLGSGLGLVLVLVWLCNAIAHTVLHLSQNNDTKHITASLYIEIVAAYSAEYSL